MFSLAPRTLLSTASRTLVSTACPRVHPIATRSFSPWALARPSLVVSVPRLPTPTRSAASGEVLHEQLQVRGYKMPSCMKKKASPIARNGGAGKTARKHSKRGAKRRRQRAKKIN
ncbi:hypothetical protein JCM10212_001554 [Sporobolomyces blumeae]